MIKSQVKSRILALVTTILGCGLMTLSAQADDIRFVGHGDQALVALTRTLQSAQKSIDMTYFIFDPCHTSTKRVMQILAQKAQQKVKVRVLLDEFMQNYGSKQLLGQFFNKYGIELRFYNNAAAISPSSNMRSHVKLTVVDGKTYFAGGRNIGDDYFSLDADENFLDRDLLVSGPSAVQATASFEELWNSRLTTRSFKAAAAPLSRENQICFQSNSRDAQLKAYLQDRGAEVFAALPVRSCSRVKFVSDSPEFGRADIGGGNPGSSDHGAGPQSYMNDMRLRYKRATALFISFLAGTQKTLELENWSYIPSERVRTEIDRLRDRQIPIQVITNMPSPDSAPLDSIVTKVTSHAAERDTRGSQAVLEIADGGAMEDRFELTPASAHFKIHGKVAVRDREDVLVGSYNIDPRSYHTNLESFVAVDNCPELARDLEGEFKALKQVYRQDNSCENCARTRKASIGAVLGWLAFNFL